MTLIEATILGIVQGAGEFLPISSSGHLIAVPWLLGYQEHSLAFDVALHLGTLVAVGAAGGLLDEKGDFPRIERPMLVDALSCVFASLVGTSTSGAYIESATGIREGARTGLAAVATAGLFAVSLFFIPLVEPLQHPHQHLFHPVQVEAVGLLEAVEIEDSIHGTPV